jgi:hypothetical protein
VFWRGANEKARLLAENAELKAEARKLRKLVAELQERPSKLSRSAFEQRMKAVESRVGRLLRGAQRCRNLRTSRTATEILKLEAAL